MSARPLYERQKMNRINRDSHAMIGRWDAMILFGIGGQHPGVLAVDPVNEDAAYLVMDAHARRGNLDMAARAYRRLHDAMSEEDSGTPSRRVRALYERVISGDALDDPSD